MRTPDVRLQGLLVGALALLLSAPVALHDLTIIISRFMVDDSFYYLEIARNVAIGNGFTFDGLHQTNGFQPFFQLLLVPLFWLPLDSEGAVRAEKLLEAFVFAVDAILLFALAKRWTGSALAGWASLAILVMPGPSLLPIGSGLFNGMESGLNAGLQLCVLHLWSQQAVGERGPGSGALYGLAIALLFLARLDNAFLIAGIAFWHAWKASSYPIPQRRGLVIAALIALSMALAYVGWNALHFGSIMPISGQIKAWASWQRTEELASQGWVPLANDTLWFVTQGKAVGLLPLAGLLSVPALLAADRFMRARGTGLVEPRLEPLLIILWLSSAAKIAYYSLFERGYNGVIWYYVQEMIELGLCFGIASHAALARIKPARAIPAVAAGIGSLFAVSWYGVVTARPIYEWELASFRMVEKIEEVVAPEDNIGAWDAGVLGYFLGNPVIQLGGLVNDREFYDVFVQGRYSEYLHENDIRYVVNLVQPERAKYFLDDWGKASFELVYRSPVGITGHPDWRYELYRVPD